MPKGFKRNPDQELRKALMDKMSDNVRKHKYPYCPCVVAENVKKLKNHADYICPCKEFRENGECHCLFWVKE